MKADLAFRGGHGGEELTDGREEFPDGAVVPGELTLEFGEFGGG